MNQASGKSHLFHEGGPGIGIAFLIGAGLSVTVGSLIPLALAIAFALASGGSSFRPYIPIHPPGGRYGPVCDFCYQRPVEWTYPCDDFEMPRPLPIPQEIWDAAAQRPMSIGPWAADDPCYRYIQSSRWDLMFERYWTRSETAQMLRATGFRRSEVQTWIEQLWERFREHRTGEPYRAGPFG